jgi:excisionase family DNA binding protein
MARLLTPHEAAELLNVTPKWMREAARNGAVPAIKLGKYWRFDAERLETWIREQSA